MVADFLRKKRPEVVAETGDRLEKRAYALIMENGYNKHDRFPVLEAAWPSMAPALPLFLAGEMSGSRPCAMRSTTSSISQAAGMNGSPSARKPKPRPWPPAITTMPAGAPIKPAGFTICVGRRTPCWPAPTAPPRTGDRAKAGARERAIAIRLRGIGHQLKKDYPAAIAAYREALELLRSLAAESEDVAIGLNCPRRCRAADSGDLAAAEGHYREALRVARAVGYAEGVATYTGNLAGLALDRKDWPAAEALAREALPLSEAVGRQELIAMQLPPPRPSPRAAGEGRRGPAPRPARGGNLHPPRLARTRRRPRDAAGV